MPGSRLSRSIPGCRWSHAAHGLEYVGASDEHGVLRVDPAAARPAIGERVWLVPGHCDPTVNLYDWIVGVRGDVVECVAGRGARGARQHRARAGLLLRR